MLFCVCDKEIGLAQLRISEFQFKERGFGLGEVIFKDPRVFRDDLAGKRCICDRPTLIVNSIVRSFFWKSRKTALNAGMKKEPVFTPIPLS